VPLLLPNQARAEEEAGALRGANDALRLEVAGLGRQVGELQEALAAAKVCCTILFCKILCAIFQACSYNVQGRMLLQHAQHALMRRACGRETAGRRTPY
jgi:hypothetical protein